MYCGIDVAKNKSQVCIMDDARKVLKEFEIEHTKEGFEQLEKHLDPSVKIGMEVTGNYSKAIYEYLKEKYDVVYVNNFQMHNFAVLNSPSIKNDRIDAKTIAEYLGYDFMKIVNLTAYNELKDLSKLYQKILKQQTRHKLMFKEQMNAIFPELETFAHAKESIRLPWLLLKYPTPEVISKATPEELHKSITNYPPKQIPKYIYELHELAKNSVGVKNHPTTCFRYTIKIMLFYQEIIDDLKNKIEEQLQKTPYNKLLDEFGYNLKSLGTIVGEVGDIRRFPNHKKFVKYCGLDVVEKQSGSSLHKKGNITKKGNRTLRFTLYMLTLSHIRYKREFYPFYQRLKDQGKHSKVCLVATARKLAIKTYYDMMKCHT